MPQTKKKLNAVVVTARKRERVAATQQRLTRLPIAPRKMVAAAARSIKNLVINHVSINTNRKINEIGRRYSTAFLFCWLG